MKVAALFVGLCMQRLLLYRLFFLLFSSEVGHILAIGLHALVVLFGQNNELAVLTRTGSGRNQVTADDVLLHALKVVALTSDGSFVEHLGGLLERCSRHEALGLESGTGDTLKYLRGSGGNGIANLHETEVSTLQ